MSREAIKQNWMFVSSSTTKLFVNEGCRVCILSEEKHAVLINQLQREPNWMLAAAFMGGQRTARSCVDSKHSVADC